MIPKPMGDRPVGSRCHQGDFYGECQQEGELDEPFGHNIPKKSSNILRIGFQNIGGFSTTSKTLKDDAIRGGITTWEFDIMGLAETNVDWRLVKEDDKLHYQTKEWWEALHISHSNNTTSPPIKPKQYGGGSIFSINKATHRVISKGFDPSNLGRWTWTRYRGRNNHTLRVICGYCPNPPSGGPFTVYAQHRQFFNTINDVRCPRSAFLTCVKEPLLPGYRIVTYVRLYWRSLGVMPLQPIEGIPLVHQSMEYGHPPALILKEVVISFLMKSSLTRIINVSGLTSPISLLLGITCLLLSDLLPEDYTAETLVLFKTI